MRSIVVAILAALALATPALAAQGDRARGKSPGDSEPAVRAPEGPGVTLVILPSRTKARDLDGFDMAVGLLSPRVGPASPAQVYLDVSQGNRIPPGLYDDALPRRLRPRPGEPIEPRKWERVTERADEAPSEIVPGLLASTLADADVPVYSDREARMAALAATDTEGAVAPAPGGACGAPDCPGLLVTGADTQSLDSLIYGLGEDDLLLAISRPRLTFGLGTIGIAGEGYEGTLTSETTRGKIVTSTDIAPTVLEHLGLEVPDDMNGREITAEGELDGEALDSLAKRFEEKGARRGPVLQGTLGIWAWIVAMVALLLGARGARVALPLLAVSLVYMPLLLLTIGSLHPTFAVEFLIVAAGGPLLAYLTLRLLPGYRGLALACALTVGAFALDLVADFGLVKESIIGPSSAAGGRFFGINNEIEAVIAVLVPVGVGAALAASSRETSTRRGVVAFLAAGAVAAVIFALGRFGADVGAAIVLPAGAAIAAAVLSGSRRLLWLAVAAPAIGLLVLVAADLVLGGGAHLTSSLVEAGGTDEVVDVFERKLVQLVLSFTTTSNLAALPLVILFVAAGIVHRRRILSWIGEREVRAGLAGAVVATVLGTLFNDSGALLLVDGTVFIVAFVGFAWSRSAGSSLAGEPPR